MEISGIEFLYQLVIVVIFFVVAVNLIFSKLLFVLRERESKTVLLEKDAEKRMSKANELSESYRAKIDLAHRETQKVVKSKKEEIMAREDEKFKAEEAKLNKEVDAERAKIVESFKAKETEIMKEAETLADGLVSKIIQ